MRDGRWDTGIVKKVLSIKYRKCSRHHCHSEGGTTEESPLAAVERSFANAEDDALKENDQLPNSKFQINSKSKILMFKIQRKLKGILS